MGDAMRSGYDRFMKKLLIVLLVLILLLCIGLVSAYFKFLHTPSLSKAERAALTPDWDRATGGNWSPWFDLDDETTEWNPTRSFNAWLATIPEENKAWPLLIDAKLEFSDVLENERYEEFSGALPNDPVRWEILVPILESERAQELTAAFQEALSKPVMGCVMRTTEDPHSIAAMQRHGIDVDPDLPVSENPMLMISYLPHLGVCRRAGEFQCMQAALALSNDDPDAFVKHLQTASQAARHSEEFPTLIGELVHVAINHTVHKTINWALVAHADRLGVDHLQQLKKMTATSTEATNGLYGELMMFHDTIRRLVSDSGKLTPTSMRNYVKFTDDVDFVLSVPSEMPIEKLGSSAQRSLLLYKENIDQNIQDSIPRSNESWNPEYNSAEFLEYVDAETGLFPTLILRIMMPSIDRATTSMLRGTQTTIATNLALSVHLHKLRHGAFPATLQDLDPDLLTMEPIDVFTGESLHYTLTDAGPLIYSVGDDRDDDGGQVRWEMNIAGPDDNLVDVRTPLAPEWIRAQDLEQRLADDPEFIDGDWVLFLIPTEDPSPLDDEELKALSDS